jgi:Flp pilus assembly pilin Flp
MLRKFLEEEEAQGSVEYVLLVGGIIFAVVAIFSVYRNMTESAWVKVNQSTGEAAEKMQNRIDQEIPKM